MCICGVFSLLLCLGSNLFGTLCCLFCSLLCLCCNTLSMLACLPSCMLHLQLRLTPDVLGSLLSKPDKAQQPVPELEHGMIEPGAEGQSLQSQLCTWREMEKDDWQVLMKNSRTATSKQCPNKQQLSMKSPLHDSKDELKVMHT